MNASACGFIKTVISIIMTFWLTQTLAAEWVEPPDDPTQNISYWKPFAIAPETDTQVEKAHQIFSQLLRAWDGSRVAPALYVVKSDAGPWAASLADGNILLSRSSIMTCFQFGEQRGTHLLAFILGHELAHQRADDLWHHKFFRLAGSQAPQVRQQMLLGLNFNAQQLDDLERREAQADHDGLIYMATVGFDPFKVLEGKDFFTVWVESTWQGTCDSAAEVAVIDKEACAQAKARAFRSQAHLKDIARQSVLFELGLQAFIAADYPKAKLFFEVFGRDFPGREIHTNLGLTEMAQALLIRQQILQLNAKALGVDFMFPLMLESGLSFQQGVATRGISPRPSAVIKKLQTQMLAHLDNAADYFDKALKINPNHALSYLLSTLTYLASGNTFMARGVLQGKYLTRFESDRSVDLLQAMISAVEKDYSKSQAQFESLLHALTQPNQAATVFPMNLLIFSTYFNYAALTRFLGKTAEARLILKRMAKHTRTLNDAVAFRLSLNQLRPKKMKPTIKLSQPLSIQNLAIGQILPPQWQTGQQTTQGIWIEGEQFQLIHSPQHVKFLIDRNHQIMAAWQESGTQASIHGTALGDDRSRVVKLHGTPSRQVYSVKGEYLAYDHLGLAVHLVNNQVSGWFLYPNTL